MNAGQNGHNHPMLLSLVALAAVIPQTLTLTPTDDVWVYPHASDPAGDGVLRVWGTGGRAVPASTSDLPEFSFGYLKWSLKDVPTDRNLKSARLVLHQVPKPGFTLEQTKSAPLEARPVDAAFEERTWTYESSEKLVPPTDAKGFFGAGFPTNLQGDSVLIEIDLLKGPLDFRVSFKKALTSGTMALALATTLDMSVLGRAGIYKIYSRDEKDDKLRPRLVLDLE